MEFSLLTGQISDPSLMIGNTIVLKPASATMQCGIEIKKIIEEGAELIADSESQKQRLFLPSNYS
jgi:acyl-CoA reductase-like NAD-dependent aldehyde dehydrogenase